MITDGVLPTAQRVAMSLSSVWVTLNSLRLRRFK
jgi:cation transport ATPase